MISRLGGAHNLAPVSSPRAAHPALVPGYHPHISWLPTAAAAAYAADLQGPDWEVWGTASMTDGSHGSTCRFDWRRAAVEGIKRRIEGGMERTTLLHTSIHKAAGCRSQGNGSIWWMSYQSSVGLTLCHVARWQPQLLAHTVSLQMLDIR